jgi:hypothetical protein
VLTSKGITDLLLPLHFHRLHTDSPSKKCCTNPEECSKLYFSALHSGVSTRFHDVSQRQSEGECFAEPLEGRMVGMCEKELSW